MSETDLTPLLIRCLRARWDASGLDAAREALHAPGFDAEAFRALATREGVAPLLYATLRGKDVLPAAVEEGLRMSYFAQAGRSLLVFRDLAQVLRALQDAGLNVLVLKGAALAEVLYGNPGVRPMCDVDLLIAPDDVTAALALLRDHGYAGGEREARAGDTLEYENEVAVFKRAATLQLMLELHWSLFDSPHHQHLIPLDWFWATARLVQIEGVAARVLGPEAQVLHLCGHVMLHHGSGATGEDGGTLRLLWLHDIAELLVRYREELDWTLLLAQARAFDLVLPLQYVVPDVVARWAVPLPAGALARLAALRASAGEARVFERLTAAKRPVAQRFYADLAALPSWRERLRFAWHNLFPSAAYMRERYGIASPWLVPFAYPYRWFIGIRGWVVRRSG